MTQKKTLHGRRQSFLAQGKRKRFLSKLGPGLITGASDDDPSGIGTYAQAGALFGLGLLWTMLFAFPLMVSIQEICARIGRVTGKGIAGNLRAHYPKHLVYLLILLLLLANILNLGADLSAMGEATQLVMGGSSLFYSFLFATASILLQVFVPYHRYVNYLKWLSAALFSYVITAFVVRVPWLKALKRLVLPSLVSGRDFWIVLVAVLGTTISPYLFFWQASQEREELDNSKFSQALVDAPFQARSELERIRIDTVIGMGFSNLVAFFVMLTSAATLHRAGLTRIETSAQAALALKPLAGILAFLLFSLGIIGTGLLAIPILAGSAAYAVGEVLLWPVGLERKFTEAKRFYALMAGAVGTGVLLNLIRLNPMKALLWSAALNGTVAVPVMFIIMHLGTNHKVMGHFKLPHTLRIGGWIATLVMSLAVGFMLVSFL